MEGQHQIAGFGRGDAGTIEIKRHRKPSLVDRPSGPSQRWEWVELTGFEPVTPSLRKMRSKRCDQGKRHSMAGLWGGCGASDVRQCEAR